MLLEFLHHSVRERFMAQVHLDLWHSVAHAEEVPEALAKLEPWIQDALKHAGVEADEAAR